MNRLRALGEDLLKQRRRERLALRCGLRRRCLAFLLLWWELLVRRALGHLPLDPVALPLEHGRHHLAEPLAIRRGLLEQRDHALLQFWDLGLGRRAALRRRNPRQVVEQDEELREHALAQDRVAQLQTEEAAVGEVFGLEKVVARLRRAAPSGGGGAHHVPRALQVVRGERVALEGGQDDVQLGKLSESIHE